MSELSSKSVIMLSHIMYAEHVLYDLFSKEDMEGNNTRKYIPVSPWNKIMYFLATFKEAEMYHMLHYLLLKDEGMDEPSMDYKTPEITRPRKKRKHSARLVSVTQRAILFEVGADINMQLSCTKWRQHESNVDMCVMNDYNPTTGYLMPQSFAHVSCTNEDGNLVLRSTCRIYDIIQRAAKQETPLSPMYPIQH